MTAMVSAVEAVAAKRGFLPAGISGRKPPIQIPMTTVRIPVRQVGELAAEVLFQRMIGASPKRHRQMLLAPELVIRAMSP